MPGAATALLQARHPEASFPEADAQNAAYGHDVAAERSTGSKAKAAVGCIQP
ncbi:hypothetical protein P775_26755 [Puniceibacterium antarcticum]|uniref:Uncharacterized protein n=1 Tax=Puniceibacterium antarcticum TaxID=1206336 RepID=A0A2G8QZG2_9RHOB|nr:hypothetical protein P775_26755 [Puniceibacterium antarcticum]